MEFFEIDWADSDIESIRIEYDRASLVIWNDTLQKKLLVVCTGLAGITNLCIWDDTIIYDTNVRLADPNDDFVRKLYGAYSKECNFGGRSLSNDLYELQIELVNNITFSIYCQKIEVIPEKTGPLTPVRTKLFQGNIIKGSAEALPFFLYFK